MERQTEDNVDQIPALDRIRRPEGGLTLGSSFRSITTGLNGRCVECRKAAHSVFLTSRTIPIVGGSIALVSRPYGCVTFSLRPEEFWGRRVRL